MNNNLRHNDLVATLLSTHDASKDGPHQSDGINNSALNSAVHKPRYVYTKEELLKLYKPTKPAERFKSYPIITSEECLIPVNLLPPDHEDRAPRETTKGNNNRLSSSSKEGAGRGRGKGRGTTRPLWADDDKPGDFVLGERTLDKHRSKSDSSDSFGKRKMGGSTEGPDEDNGDGEARGSAAPAMLMWQYKDPQGEVQGPFTNDEMVGWHEAGYFGPDLLVRKAHHQDFVPLKVLIKKSNGVPFPKPVNKERESEEDNEEEEEDDDDDEPVKTIEIRKDPAVRHDRAALSQPERPSSSSAAPSVDAQLQAVDRRASITTISRPASLSSSSGGLSAPQTFPDRRTSLTAAASQGAPTQGISSPSYPLAATADVLLSDRFGMMQSPQFHGSAFQQLRTSGTHPSIDPSRFGAPFQPFPAESNGSPFEAKPMLNNNNGSLSMDALPLRAAFAPDLSQPHPNVFLTDPNALRSSGTFPAVLRTSGTHPNVLRTSGTYSVDGNQSRSNGTFSESPRTSVAGLFDLHRNNLAFPPQDTEQLMHKMPLPMSMVQPNIPIHPLMQQHPTEPFVQPTHQTFLESQQQFLMHQQMLHQHRIMADQQRALADQQRSRKEGTYQLDESGMPINIAPRRDSEVKLVQEDKLRSSGSGEPAWGGSKLSGSSGKLSLKEIQAEELRNSRQSIPQVEPEVQVAPRQSNVVPSSASVPSVPAPAPAPAAPAELFWDIPTEPQNLKAVPKKLEPVPVAPAPKKQSIHAIQLEQQMEKAVATPEPPKPVQPAKVGWGAVPEVKPVPVAEVQAEELRVQEHMTKSEKKKLAAAKKAAAAATPVQLASPATSFQPEPKKLSLREIQEQELLEQSRRREEADLLWQEQERKNMIAASRTGLAWVAPAPRTLSLKEIQDEERRRKESETKKREAEAQARKTDFPSLESSDSWKNDPASGRFSLSAVMKEQMREKENAKLQEQVKQPVVEKKKQPEPAKPAPPTSKAAVSLSQIMEDQKKAKMVASAPKPAAPAPKKAAPTVKDDDDDLFWNAPDPSKAKPKPSESAPKKEAAKPPASTNAAKAKPPAKSNGAANTNSGGSTEFMKWCQGQLKVLTGSNDTTFAEFLISLHSPSDIEEYAQQVLGSSEKANNFIAEFIRQRDFHVLEEDQKKRGVVAKPAKKKNARMQKVDPSMLGFAAPPRVDIEYLEDA